MSRKTHIQALISQQFNPTYLVVEDESKNHHVPPGSESHFKITLITSQFDGLNRLARHRLINSLLKEEFDKGLHALSMHLYTPIEWENLQNLVPKSPNCKDGFEN